jgi:hypothetical protein
VKGQLEPLDDVDGLQQLDPLFECGLGCVARSVREPADLANRADECRDAPVVTAQLEDLFDHGAVLSLELAGLDARRLDVRTLFHLDAETSPRVGVGGARDSAVQADDIDGRTGAGQAHALSDLGDRADLRVLAFVAGHEQDALLVADVGRDGDVHVGEDDDVVKGD